MVEKVGHIIIGSTAAKEVYPNGNVYCATKHDALNQGMHGPKTLWNKLVQFIPVYKLNSEVRFQRRD
jgi:NADP-dependent 3-hydroxy acid dehydrogenase YdfG